MQEQVVGAFPTICNRCLLYYLLLTTFEVLPFVYNKRGRLRWSLKLET